MPNMDTEKKDSLFHKVKYFLWNRHKLVRFSLPTKLHWSPNLGESLKSLAQNRFQEYEPVKSHVWLEQYDQDTPLAVFPLCEGNIWEFLYSNMWLELECSSLRVTEGELLDRLLETLFSFEMRKKVLTYTTTAYQRTARTRLLNCMKRCEQREEVVEENIKITFTYYGTSSAGLQRALSHYGHVSAADNVYSKLFSTWGLDPPRHDTSTPSFKTASRQNSTTCTISKSKGSSSTSQASSKPTDKLSNSDDSQVVVKTDSIMMSTTKSATPSESDLQLEEDNLDNLDKSIPDTDTVVTKSETQIITAIPVPGRYNPNNSHLLSSDPVYIKSMGIFVEPPLNFLCQKTIHFKDEEQTSNESLSASSWSDESIESMASRRSESLSSPQTLDVATCIMDKKSVEIFPDEYMTLKSRPLNCLKKTTAEILQESLNRRKRAKAAGADVVSNSPKLEPRVSLNTPKDHKVHATVTFARENVERPKRLHNSRLKQIDPNALNLQYSIDKLAVPAKDGQKNKEKQRKIGKAGEKQRRAATSAVDKESPVHETDLRDGYNVTFSNLSVFFDLGSQNRPGYPTENTQVDEQPLFMKISPDEFKESFIKAIDDLVVRKEQITSSRGYKTVTTITFNKPFPNTR